MIGMIVALHVAQDGFGTACNVTGDGSIAVITERINNKYFEKAS
jgi:Na+/H+-dicarboxylate symporter